MPRPPRRNRVGTRADLVRAASDLVAAGKPLEARAVAKKAGRSLGTLTHHFEDSGMDGLREAVVLEGLRRLHAALRGALDAHRKPRDRARALGRAYVDFAWGNPRLYRLMRTGEWTSPDVARLNYENWELGLGAVADLQAAGVLRREDVRLQLSVLWTALHGVASLALDRFFVPDDPGRLLDQTLDVLFAGLKPA